MHRMEENIDRLYHMRIKSDLDKSFRDFIVLKSLSYISHLQY